MLPFLVSFCYAEGQFGPIHGSHIMYLPEVPSTAQAMLDLQASIGMEYNVDGSAILGYDFLPDRYTHPSGGSPYCYFLTYSIAFGHKSGLGSLSYLIEEPICALDTLRFVEEEIRSGLQAQEVHLVSCKPLRESTPQQLQNYQQMR